MPYGILDARVDGGDPLGEITQGDRVHAFEAAELDHVLIVKVDLRVKAEDPLVGMV